MSDNISTDEIVENIKKATVYYQEIVSYMLKHKMDNLKPSFMDEKRASEIYAKTFSQVMESPEKFTSVNLEYVNNFQKLLADSVGRFIGKAEQRSHAEYVASRDRRFRDPAWQDNVYFDFIKQYYIISSEWIKKTIEQYDLDEEAQKYLEFTTSQFIDAISPSNFMFSNPEVIRESLQSGMGNIVKGMENFLNDVKQSADMFTISTTDNSVFQLGKNIAITPGKVIYQNDLVQLICYEPKKKVHEIPLLILPPWINKYYIMDLSENNSLVKWLVDNNYQVFLVSWVNPDEKLAHKNFEDYLKEGVLEPYEFLSKTLGYKTINTAGYCIGGTLLAIALAYFKAKKLNPINSATFFTTLVDFSQPGEIGALVNKSSIDTIEKQVTEKGYLDGKYLSNSFSLIRANDLVWSFFVNNYLLGKTPAAFDILYWNSDAANLPAAMYIYYLRNMYIDNLLKEPDRLEMLGTKIDLSKIDVPSFSVAAKSDHIALWKGVYAGYQLFKGDKTFCLTDAGHVAGVVNPANNDKYAHHVGSFEDAYQKPDAWLKGSKYQEGSWWKSWGEWLKTRSGGLVPAIDYDNIKFLELAPGSYVMKK